MQTVTTILLFIMAGWIAFGVLGTPFLIGKPRKPLTPGTALVSMLLGSAIVFALVTLALNPQTFP